MVAAATAKKVQRIQGEEGLTMSASKWPAFTCCANVHQGHTHSSCAC